MANLIILFPKMAKKNPLIFAKLQHGRFMDAKDNKGEKKQSKGQIEGVIFCTNNLVLY
jgi:hypothetical protein